MKKGCFVKSVILLTILTAVLLYLINYRFNDFVFNPGKKLIISEISNEIEYVKDSPEKDSLNLLLKNYVMNIKDIKHVRDRDINEFADSLKAALADSIISREEYRKLRKILNQKEN